MENLRKRQVKQGPAPGPCLLQGPCSIPAYSRTAFPLVEVAESRLMRVITRHFRPFLYLFALLCVLVYSEGGRAQDTTASLQGTVSDSSGARIPGARVEIVNVATNATQTITTDGSGIMSFPRLAVGEYRLTVEKEGFSPYVQSGITLSVGQAATTDVTLRVGTARNVVSVTSDADLVDTRTSGSNQLINEKQIVDLPLNGRNAVQLLQLAPGTVNQSQYGCSICGQGGVYPGESTANVNGSTQTQVNYQMDGVSHNDTYLNASLPFANPDALQEFALQSSNFSAEYGNASGGIVNIIAKSGTNTFHGSAFEFLRNGSMNAKNYFGTTHDSLHRNQYGGTLGGPILKNKLFFFATYQGTRSSSASSANISFVPTAAERTGDFSALLPQVLVDPVSGVPLIDNQIPASRLNLVAQNLLKHVPLPNGPNGMLTFTGSVGREEENQGMAKIDYTLGRNQFTGRYFVTDYMLPAVQPPTANILAATSAGNHVRVQTIAVIHTYTQSPTLLFSTTFGLNMQRGGSLSSAPFSWADLGSKVASGVVPEISMGISGGFGISTNHLGQFDRGDFTISESVVKIIGRHELHLGGQALRVSNNLVNTYRQAGGFSFNGQLSGNGLADFIFGRASSFSQGGGEYKNFAGTQWALFAQDNWRVTQALTINAGLRWDPWLPYYDRDGRVTCFVPGEQSTRYPNAPTGLLYGGTNHDKACPTAGSLPFWPQMGPRLGFAYRLTEDGRNSVRGGFGIYYTPVETTDYNHMADTAPFSPGFHYNSVDFTDPYGSVGSINPFPAQYGPTLPDASVKFTLPVSMGDNFERNFRPPMLESWNLILEHQIGKTSVARLAYIGNHGLRLSEATDRELNPAIYIPGQSTVANTQARRAYQSFSNVPQLQSSAISNYNGMQVSFETRLMFGLSLLTNYTWSKGLDNIGWTSPYTRALDYGRSNQDLAHNFKFGADWALPFPHSQSAFINRAVDGWKLNAITLWQSGFPITIMSGVDNSFTGVGSDRADYLGGSTQVKHSSHAEMAAKWFDTSRFVTNAVGTFGNASRNQLRIPRDFNTDLSLLKNTALLEGVSLQFGVDAFNAFNNVNFGYPDTYVSDSQFGSITSALDPRILQLSAKIKF